MVGGFLGEEESQGRLDRLRLARGQHMELKHHVGAGVEAPGHVGGPQKGTLARRPTLEVAAGTGGLVVEHAVVSRLRILGLVGAGGPGGVHQDHDMVDDGGVAGTELHASHVTVAVDGTGDHEVADHVGTVGREGVDLWHPDDQVGLAQLPALGPLGRRGQICRVPFQQLFSQPILEQLQFPDGETPVPDEAAPSRLGQPGRHVAVARDHLDLVRPCLDLLVGQEAEGGHLSRPVAGSTALVDDGGDVPVEGDGSGGLLGGVGGTAGCEENRQAEADQTGREAGGFEISFSTGGLHFR